MPTQGAALVMADASGRITHFNADAERLFGHGAAAAIGQSLDLIVPPAFREKHWGGFRRAIETGICKLDRAATNLPVLCSDGEVRAFPARFVFLQDARGNVVGAMGIYADAAGGEQAFGPVLART